MFESSNTANCFSVEENMKPSAFTQPEARNFCCAFRSDDSERNVPKLGRHNPTNE